MKKLVITKEELLNIQFKFPLLDFTDKMIDDLIKVKLKDAGFSLIKKIRRYEQFETLSIIFEQDE